MAETGAPTVALSTCWLSHRHTDGYAMIEEMAGLGFDCVELSHGIRITLVEGILKAVEEGLVKVASVHNFCPLPMHVSHAAPNLYEPSSPDGRERSLWLRNTLRTLDFARQVGAGRCIVHSGSARFFWRDPGAAVGRAAGGRPPEALAVDRRYQRVLEKSMERMRRAAPPFMLNLRASFSEILPHAAERGVRLCMENREGFTELPMDHEMAGFIGAFPQEEPIGYWHDSGHAQLKEREGIISHRQLLEMNRGRHFGFHLHDVSSEGRDHQPLGSGTIDFDMVSRYFQPDHLLVLEMSPRLPVEAVETSRDVLLGLLARGGFEV